MLRQVPGYAYARRLSVLKGRNYTTSSIDTQDSCLNLQNSLSRLIEISNILQSSKRLKYTTNECYNHYQKVHANLVEDILQNKEESRQLFEFLTQNYSKSKLVSALVLDLLCDLLCQNKTEACSEYIGRMTLLGLDNQKGQNQGHILSPNSAPLDSISFRLGSTLIFQAVLSGDPILAALIAFRMHEKGIHIAPSDVDMLVSNLSVESPQKQTYNSYIIIRLLEVFGESSITAETLGRAVAAMIPTNDAPYFANVMYDRMDTANPEYINVTRKLIRANIDSGNYVRATRLWKYASKAEPRFAAANVGLFRDLLESISNQKQVVSELLENHFPADLEAHTEIIHFLIKFYGRSGEKAKFDLITRQLKPPLLRQALSLLFALFLAQNNEKGAARLLKAIFGTKNGLTCDDFEAIITKLLLLHNVQQAMKMCAENNVEVSKLGYVGVLEFLLLHDHITEAADMAPEDYALKREQFYQELLVRLSPLEKGDVAQKKFTSVILAHLSHRVNTGSCRKLYICGAYSRADFNFGSHKMPDDFNKLVHIDLSNRLGCVLEVLRRALWEKDADNINWCVEEMKILGTPIIDIVEFKKMET